MLRSVVMRTFIKGVMALLPDDADVRRGPITLCDGSRRLFPRVDVGASSLGSFIALRLRRGVSAI